jgi:hypothetical protein
MPVFFELDLVQNRTAFFDVHGRPFYYFAFIRPITRIIGPFDPSDNWQTLDLVLSILFVAAGVSWFRGRRGMTREQRRLAGGALLLALVFIAMTMRESSVLWRIATPLQKTQYPWRMLTVVTVLVCAAAGAMPYWRRGRLRKWTAGAVVLILLALSARYTSHRLSESRAPQTPAALAAIDFRPDTADEWLPVGASADVPPQQRSAPRPGSGCRVMEFSKTQGHVRCHVLATNDTHLVLPHYAFPVGWRATLNQQPIPLASDSLGLMKVDLPSGSEGWLDIRFTNTPARRAGLWLSGLALIVFGASPAVWHWAKALKRRVSGSTAHSLVR